MRNLMLIILFLCSAIVSSQETTAIRPIRTAEEEAQKRTQRLSRELLLDSLQRDTVYQINLIFAKERRENEFSKTDYANRTKRYNSMLQNVLTKEQFSRFLQLQQQTTARRQVMTRVVSARDSIIKKTISDSIK